MQPINGIGVGRVLIMLHAHRKFAMAMHAIAWPGQGRATLENAVLGMAFTTRPRASKMNIPHRIAGMTADAARRTIDLAAMINRLGVKDETLADIGRASRTGGGVAMGTIAFTQTGLQGMNPGLGEDRMTEETITLVDIHYRIGALMATNTTRHRHYVVIGRIHMVNQGMAHHLTGMTGRALATPGNRGARQGAQRIMTALTTVGAVNPGNQIGVGVTNHAGGGGLDLNGVRDVQRLMDVEIAMASQAIARTRNATALQQPGRQLMAKAAI